MYIVVGLGNPGRKYEHTRHNVGFDVLEVLSQKYDIPIRKLRCKAAVGEGTIRGERVVLAQPQTFMNLSGESVVELMNSVPLNTLRRIRKLPKADAWRLLIDDAEELKILLPLYRAAARGEDPRMLPEWSAIEKMDTTTGHYFRGVE